MHQQKEPSLSEHSLRYKLNSGKHRFRNLRQILETVRCNYEFQIEAAVIRCFGLRQEAKLTSVCLFGDFLLTLS